MTTQKLQGGRGGDKPSQLKKNLRTQVDYALHFSLAVVFITADTEVPDLLKTKANPKKIQPLRQHSLLDLGKKKSQNLRLPIQKVKV